MISYLVSKLAKGELSNLVKECFGTDFPDIFRKPQIDYIYRYLTDLGAKSVLLEPKYVDKDYLEDFNHYYLKCFGNNGAMSARLHFFSRNLDHQKMTEILADGDTDEIHSLQDSYLGFVVIKPLAKTFIGKTCLRTYPSINHTNKNKICLLREYSVDLFGIPMKVSSVAFQEQDKVVSACATTAIWSSLHAMHWKNVRDIRACSEITTNAINHISGSSNSFPNRDLSNKQILRALDFEKLKHHTADITSYSSEDFFKTVKTYIDSKIPLILGVDVYEKKGSELEPLDGHAVTIVGYKKQSGPKQRAIYVHDDRLGPFARAAFVSLDKDQFEPHVEWGLELQQKNDCGEWEAPHEVLVLNSLIIPTPHKVRLPSSYARKTCDEIVSGYHQMRKDLIDKLGEADTENLSTNLSYDIILSEISDIRQELLKQKFTEDVELLNKEKVKFLTGSYARFQWVASFNFDGEPIFKVIFDATNIPQGNAISSLFVQNKELTDLVLERHRQIAISDRNLLDIDIDSFYGQFLKYLKPEQEGLSAYLDKTFGELRAPKYIKETEMGEGDILNSEVDRYYASVPSKLEEKYPDIKPDDPGSFLIWTISSEGVLLIGREKGGKGHPTLTGFKPSRIAGELKRSHSGWFINSKSGRYSTDYSNTNELLGNAVEKFKDIFRESRKSITAEFYNP
ncbi:C39 family peptidase [Shewanella algae]|nr:C39 family peptidase [Shewanella algae]